MTTLNEWNAFYKKASYHAKYRNPEDVLGEKTSDLTEDLDPELLAEWVGNGNVPEYQEENIFRDYSAMNAVYRVGTSEGDKFYQLSGFYDSWNGTEWEDDTWVEVVKKTRTEEYWSEV